MPDLRGQGHDHRRPVVSRTPLSLWISLALGLWSLIALPCEGFFLEALFGMGASSNEAVSTTSTTTIKGLDPTTGLTSVDSFIVSTESQENREVCGGSCRFAMSCWLSGGHSVSGGCDSLFYSCCQEQAVNVDEQQQQQQQRDPQNLGGGPQAEARKMSYLWPDLGLGITPEIPDLPEIHYGPVVNEPNCGTPKMTKRRIVGGHDAGFGTYPWQALIRIRTSRCGGALVGPRHVVTAGHCVQAILHEMKLSTNSVARKDNSGVASRKAAYNGIQVFLGEYSLYTNMEPLPRQGFTVDQIFLHPYYEFTPQADRFDVAVLKLNRPVRFDWHILPVCLPERGSVPEVGSEAMVTGWGATSPNSLHRPTELQAVDVKIVDSRQCEKWHQKNGIELKVYEDMMCAGHELGGKDACQGDSGGPLVEQSVKGNWTLVGLVSAGFSCAKPGQPGIYHKVSRTSDWISYVKLYL